MNEWINEWIPNSWLCICLYICLCIIAIYKWMRQGHSARSHWNDLSQSFKRSWILLCFSHWLGVKHWQTSCSFFGQRRRRRRKKIPHMCESIGHWPLRGRCPAPPLNFQHNLLRQGTGTADHLTLLRLFSLLLSP